MPVQPEQAKARAFLNIIDMHDMLKHLRKTLLKELLNWLGQEVKGLLNSNDACENDKLRAKLVKWKQIKTGISVCDLKLFLNSWE